MNNETKKIENVVNRKIDIVCDRKSANVKDSKKSDCFIKKDLSDYDFSSLNATMSAVESSAKDELLSITKNTKLTLYQFNKLVIALIKASQNDEINFSE